ncbi:uncharacterized protein LOC125068816 [Vanessa atalanta]|uniref:uncharacterized protein LOC125068816 n=1 Tax=Vanessa atalanta TaxID=42275 RepID=UPI001FCCEA78|nr:uncharacterized protein LOC125068816 [Vanessa atalanta]
MGCIWKVTMPLLSTLAALVIIVHSAEENYEQNYRQIRPRALDLTQTNYDQSWRAIEVEPETTPLSTVNQGHWDDEGSNQPMRRRRRKRKRRPQQSLEDITPQEGTSYREASQAHQEDVIEMPRRRRKKADYQDSKDRNRPTHWSDEGLERPLRRRGQRRKRPPLETWPELSEFNGFRPVEQPDSSEEILHEKETRIDSNIDNSRNEDRDENEKIESNIEIDDQSEAQFVEVTTQINHIKNNLKYEAISHKDGPRSVNFMKATKPNTTLKATNEKNIEKLSTVDNNVEIPKENGPLDPYTLKDILRKSNGKSLSEILQQNNLSLADLLHGKEKAISVLQRKDVIDGQDASSIKSQTMFVNSNIKSVDPAEKMSESEDQEKTLYNLSLEVKENIETTTDCSTNTESVTFSNTESSENSETLLVESTTKSLLRRRFPIGVRRKLRMRPALNNTYKGQLSRDLITLTSLKYKNSKTLTKSKEWKDVLPAMTRRGQTMTEPNIKIIENNSNIVVKLTTTTITPEETTTEQIFETTTDPSDAFINTEISFFTDNEKIESLESADTKGLNFKTETPSPTTVVNQDYNEDKVIVTEKPVIVPILRPQVNSSELRRQAYSNRLKRKRLKQKISTTVSPELNHHHKEPADQGLKNIYGTANYISTNEFISKTQTRTTNYDQEDDFSTLEDFMTTEASNTMNDITKSTRIPQRNHRLTTSTTQAPATTGETAKYEIDEILSDNLASARLSKILKERNMTLRELVEHRERGSSHIHLADIFHNTSKEPNPPEPFLSKSLIEPISKETYPLRALLEANSYDPKTTTFEPNLNATNNLNIPVVMDFGNNVNENGENMGIISLFKNFSRIDSEGQSLYDDRKKVFETNSDDADVSNHEATREGRLLNSEKDLITWNDLITLMQQSHQNENLGVNKHSRDDLAISDTLKKNNLENEIDGDSLTVLEDIQKLKDFDSRITSDELLEMKLFENVELTQTPSATSTVSNNTKSVTVATASIIGLVLILFLLTYAILKWKQQNKMFQKKHAKEEECVPTPIFENRKGHKINSSTRSKSPMISSNVYAIDSIDTRARSESPEYMWDTLRKPFQ